MSYAENVAWSDLMEDMQASGTGDTLQSAIGRFAHRLGFDWFAYVSKSPEQTSARSNYPTEWQRLYRDRDYLRIDPVVEGVTKGPKPFAWDGAEYAARRVRTPFFAAAADFSIRAGIAVPMAGTYGQLAFMTFAASSNDNLHPVYAENLSFVTLAALHFHMHHNRLLTAERNQALGTEPVLTRHERICLTWVARGKTIGETATILAVHEATVRYHLNNARHRLAAITLPQAVAIALRRGEIE